MIGNDGRVYEGRGWTTMPAQARGYNSVSYGIAFLGNYMNVLPTQAALNAAQALIQCGMEKVCI
ncbi:MAG: hypothetical protein GXO35_09480 [Gammaproteobacteria bacterium]|nr:hypothetical protein [Gammaproteobacteria bacterium]